MVSVLKIFNLRMVNTAPWEELEMSSLLDYLVDNIARIQRVAASNFQEIEASSRTIIDQILVAALDEQDPVRQATTAGQADYPQPLKLHFETQLQRKVMHEDKKYLLSGYADWTFSYTTGRRPQPLANLLVIEAKRAYSADTAQPQLACYMGLVHASRKEAEKENAIVYGATTDGKYYRFCRIDNDGNWSTSDLYEWGRLEHTEKIWSIFRSLIKIAQLSSPSSSPVKNPNQKEEVRGAFHSPTRTRIWNYQLSQLELIEVEEDDDEYEVWDLTLKK